jgi:hypothetical protein
MRSRFRTLSVLTIVAAAAGSAGCGGKNDSQPNPDMKVPDIPPGKRDMPKEGGQKPGKTGQ